MYVLVIYIFRSLIPTDIRLKDKFMSLRENNPKNIKSNSNNNQKKTNKFLYQIKLQTSPHTHNIILYIALGLIFKSLNLIIIFLSIYLSLWYLWENYKVVTKAIIIDKK